MMREVGAYEAKTRLPELLREVERGERITITVRGKPVAELTPARRTPADAVAEMQAFEPIKGVDPATVADWIEEGRR
jgi:prevent-host-death family protein